MGAEFHILFPISKIKVADLAPTVLKLVVMIILGGGTCFCDCILKSPFVTFRKPLKKGFLATKSVLKELETQFKTQNHTIQGMLV